MKRSPPEPEPARAAEERPLTDDQSVPFETAFRRLFEKDFGRLFRYLDRLTGDAELADDVAQDSFVRLHRRGSLPDNPSPWLVAVARNLLRDEWRGRARRRQLLQLRRAAGDLDPPMRSSPEREVLSGEAAAQVRRVLAMISPRDRQMLLLRQEGYSYREIAEALEVAPGSIGTMLVRATAAFKQAFEEVFNAP